MQLLDGFLGSFCLLDALAEDVLGIAQQLLLPVGDLVGMGIIFF
jgi:hypothetical protein